MIAGHGMKEILRRINKIPGVRGTLIVGADGLLIASDLADDEDATQLSAVAASVTVAVTNAITRLGTGDLNRFVLKGSDGTVVFSLVRGAIVLTLVRKDANMGMVLVELKDASQKLAESMGT